MNFWIAGQMSEMDAIMNFLAMQDTLVNKNDLQDVFKVNFFIQFEFKILD